MGIIGYHHSESVAAERHIDRNHQCVAICDTDLELFDLLQHSLLLRDCQRFVLLTELQLPDFLVDVLVATHPQVAILAAEGVPDLLLCRLLCPELLLPCLLLLLSLLLPARGTAGVQVTESGLLTRE